MRSRALSRAFELTQVSVPFSRAFFCSVPRAETGIFMRSRFRGSQVGSLKAAFFALLILLTICGTADAQSSSVLQVLQVASGGETRAASTALQPTSAFSLEAWITASATHTNYPAFISYGLDTASPYEAY